MADAIGDPVELLAQFKKWVSLFAENGDFAMTSSTLLREALDKLPLNEDRDRYRAPMPPNLEPYAKGIRDIVSTMGMGNWYKRAKPLATSLFFSLLQQYAILPALSKGVEAATRFWDKTRTTVRLKSDYKFGWAAWIEYLDAYVEVMDLLNAQVVLGEKVLATAKLHSDPDVAATTRIPVGSFTLVNTGNFDEKVMATNKEVVAKAERALREIGLAKVCYGDILVTKTISQSSRIMAFYLIKNDEMFVRANIRPGWDTVQTVCHELTHRLIHKFLASKKAEIRNLFRTVQNHQNDIQIPLALYPNAGDKLVFKGENLVVTGVDFMKSKVNLAIADDPKSLLSMKIDAWCRVNNIQVVPPEEFKGFVTQYAATDPDENFCEMVSYYALGKLPKVQIPLIEAILNG
jgi:hypothetical protein